MAVLGDGLKGLQFQEVACPEHVPEVTHPDRSPGRRGLGIWIVVVERVVAIGPQHNRTGLVEHDLGVDPGLQKDGVEKHLRELLAEHPATLAEGLTLVRREYPTAIGPVDLMCRDAEGAAVAVEVKRRGEIDGVEQLTRYLELLNRDPKLRPVRGIFAAQEIKPQARVLATDRGIACAVVDYDALRGMDDPSQRLF